MKKIFALCLSLIAAISVLSACGDKEEDADKGATIPLYISSEIFSFDPADAYHDEAAVKILGLIYEGLYKINNKGECVKSQAKSVKILDKPSEDYYAIEITLKDTCWSDGTKVQAADYVYAWKRILEPEFMGEAASMLFDIKNAREVNKGDMSIDDLGVYDSATNVLTIEFETAIDYNQFYEYLASPLLVPLRETAINKVKEDWASSSQIVVCNGPFVVRTFTPGETLVLERNIYYYRDIEEDGIKKYVTPYRLSINFKKGPAENLADFESGKLAYNSEIALAKRQEYASKSDVTDTMSVLSYVFNTTKAPFNNANVRKALSIAIDRNKIAEILTFAEPAEGLISDKVFNAGYKSKKSFRGAGEKLISESADVLTAKSLLSSAGVSSGNITITLRNNEADIAVAEYVKTVWESLGFSVTLDKLSYDKYKNEDEYDLVADKYLNAYKSGEFDVMSIDLLMMSTDAFPTLAQFAKSFAGGKMDLTGSDFALTPHISGYDSSEYDAKIEEAFKEKDRAKRAILLHEAEKILVNDAPIIPLVQLQHASVTNKDLSKLSANYFGFDLFAKAKLNDYESYLETAAS